MFVCVRRGYLRVLLHVEQELLVQRVARFFLLHAEDASEALYAEAVGELCDADGLAVDHGGDFGLVFDDDCDLGVPEAEHAAVVDVRAADDGDLVVDDHHLRVDVDLLGGRQAVRHHFVLAQAEELDVVARVLREVLQPAQRRLLLEDGLQALRYRQLLETQRDPRERAFALLHRAFEAREQRDHHEDHEVLPALNRSPDSQHQRLRDAVLQCLARGARDEELVLDVDEALRSVDRLDVRDLD